MIKHEPENRISLSEVIEYLEPLQLLQPPNRLSLMQYDQQNLLRSTGTLSSHVYDIGTFEGSSLAVKRVPFEDCTTKSFDELKQLDHSNIIRLLHFDQDDVFKFVRNSFIIILLRLRKFGFNRRFYRFFGMEFCVASLDQLFLPEDDPKRFRLTNNFVPNLSVDCSTFTKKNSSTVPSNPPIF